jgi:hypothetical protein
MGQECAVKWTVRGAAAAKISKIIRMKASKSVRVWRCLCVADRKLNFAPIFWRTCEKIKDGFVILRRVEKHEKIIKNTLKIFNLKKSR